MREIHKAPKVSLNDSEQFCTTCKERFIPQTGMNLSHLYL